MLKIFIVFLLSLRHCCTSSIKGYIVGGTQSNIVHFPYATYIVGESQTGAFLCGSSVVNQQVLLTAGHCIAELLKLPWSVFAFAGGGDIREARSVRTIKIMITHDKYEEDTLLNDIGLAKVTKKLTLGKFIKRSVIPIEFPMDVTSGIIAGWGIFDETTGEHGLKLLHLKQTLQSNDLCNFIVGDMSKDMFCAGSFENQDPRPAAGDSGSAFIVKHILQIGILSFRPHDNRALSVYTNLTSYYTWIKETSITLYCD